VSKDNDDGDLFGFLKDKTRLKKGLNTSKNSYKIKTTSGNIYGPVSEDKIIDLILRRKLKGNEFYIHDNIENWKLLSDNVVFYDAFKSRSKKITKNKGSLTNHELTDVKEKPIIVKEKKFLKVKGKNLSVKNIDKSQKINKSSHSEFTLKGSLRSDSNQHVIKINNVPNAGPHNSVTIFKKYGRYIVVFLLFLIGFLSFDKFGKKNQGKSIFTKTNISLPYLNSVNHLFENMTYWDSGEANINVNKVNLSFELLGFSLNDWHSDYKELLENIKNKKTHTSNEIVHFITLSRLMSSTASVFYPVVAKKLELQADKVFKSFKNQLSSNDVLFLSALNDLLNEKASNAKKLFDRVSDFETAEILSDWCVWLSFWANGAKGSVELSTTKYQNYTYNNLRSIMKNFFTQNIEIENQLDMLSNKNALNPFYWFSKAQWSWRIKSQPDSYEVNKWFSIGLACLSQWPISFQKIYWNEYYQFLRKQGEHSILKNIINNFNLISKNEDLETIESNWWRITDRNFSYEKIAQDSLDNLNSKNQQKSDLATVMVLSVYLKSGNKHFIQIADYFLFNKTWSKAITFYDKALKVSKYKDDVYGKLSISYAYLYQFDIALDLIDKISTKRKIKYQAILNSIVNNFTESNELFETYLENEPQDSFTRYFYALSLQKQSKYLECVKQANTSKLSAKGELAISSSFLVLQCQLQSGVGKQKALLYLEKYNQKFPTQENSWLNYADGLLIDNQLRQAEELLIKADSRFPNNFKIKMKIAEIFKDKGAYEEAVLLYQRAAKENLNNPLPYISIAQVFSDQNKHLEASQNYLTAAFKDPNFPEIWLFTARSYRKAKQFKKAAEYYIKEIEQRPAVLSTFIEAARFFLEYNAPAEVPKILSKFSESYHDDPRVILLLAQAYQALKDYQKAKEQAELVLKYEPKSSQAHKIIANNYDLQGQYSAAKLHYQLYLELAPEAGDYSRIKQKITQFPYQ